MISAPLIEYLKKGIFTVLGLMLAVYLFVILLTYTGNDPSWSHISSDMTTVNNTGGAMGAWLSDLLYSFFGFGSWWLLAFLIYESTLIWWGNKPALWILRLVAYVFLILSASALIAQFIALLNHVTNPVPMGLKGLAGGIIGTELQIRLAQLLTPWGSLVFLTIFVIITATFAFNIHWLKLYQTFTNLAWLGSGVKAEENNAKAANHTSPNTNKRSRVQNGKDLIISKMMQKKSDYGQLPLELQPAHSVHDDSASQTAMSPTRESQGQFSGMLSDFLAQSGLVASIKATMAEEAASRAIHEKLQPATAMPNDTYAKTNVVHNTSHTSAFTSHSNSSAAPMRKVEPSFAWNDAGIVHDLLANEFIVEENNPNSNPIPNSAPAVDLNIAPIDEDSSASVNAPTVESINTQIEDTNAPTADGDALLDTWLAEQDSFPESTFSPSEAVDDVAHHHNAVIKPVIKTPVESIENLPTVSIDEPADEPLDVFAAMVSQTSIPAMPVVAKSEPSIAKAEAITPVAELHNHQQYNPHSQQAAIAATEMTPTNTAPANPPIASQPTISFAVPDGDSSNHITDMMPDAIDDEFSTPSMPEIHDDAAFSNRSRSMQTAAYRAQLSPIPSLAILDKPDPNHQPSYTTAELEQLSELLEIKLQEFNVKANVVNAIPGPVVTRFEVELAPGVKASKVTGISRDLARSLSMASLRVVEVIPGKPYIGIEVPNKQREMVRLIELLDTEKFKDPKSQISIAMGKDIGGKPIISDLARAPHMLVAGTTGSGKSVLVNSMLLSMLLKYTPEQLRLILIDPKQLELANYNDIPHLLTPVVTDMTEAASSLSWCVAEMERRYFLMSVLKVRKLSDFNRKVRAAEKAGQPILDPLWRTNDSVSISQAPKMKTLPMIVIVADEFADMIMQVGKQAEELITRLAQKSRAAGIHLILATQRPSVDVITGLIKANIPVRAALRVNSKVDSRTILDSGGAEDMLGNGDMLFLGPGQIEPDRVHGAYVSDEEVNSVCDAWRERGAPDYIDNMAGNFELSSIGSGSTGSPSGEDDDLYNEAVAFIMETRKVSASSIQRKFSIGYNRAARIVDSMEEAGIVSPMGKSGKRELLM